MKFTFEITNFEGAEANLRMSSAFHPEHLISIGATWDPDPAGLENYKGNLLRLKFSDVKFKPHIPEGSLSYGISAPTIEHVQEIIDFGKTVETGHLLVHCEMGISRSSAATLIVLAMHSDPSQAKELGELVQKARKIARPNNMILEYADELLGWGGALAALGGWDNDWFYGRTGSGR